MLDADATIIVSARFGPSRGISKSLAPAVLTRRDGARRVRWSWCDQESTAKDRVNCWGQTAVHQEPGRTIGRTPERGGCSTPRLAVQQESVHCERRSSAARGSGQSAERAGATPLFGAFGSSGCGPGRGRSCPRHARTAADRTQQLRANLDTIDDRISAVFLRVKRAIIADGSAARTVVPNECLTQTPRTRGGAQRSRMSSAPSSAGRASRLPGVFALMSELRPREKQGGSI